MITCGKCKSKHPTVADVRACYAGRITPADVSAANRGYQTALADPAAAFDADGFLSDAEETRLIQQGERVEDERVAAYKAQRDDLANRSNNYAAKQTSQNINVADWGKVRELGAKLPNLPHMRYAIQVIDFEKSPEPVWKFYQVDKPTKGKWVGRTFLNVQASDTTYPVRKPDSIVAVFEAILADPQKAVSEYGHQLGKCGICDRTLTDPESIARGIGPVCAGKAGW